MRYLYVFGSIVLLAAAASAQDYQVGEYYEPYGTCTGVNTTSVDTVYEAPPSVGYPERTAYYPDYSDRTVYYPRPVMYAAPVYQPRYYDPWWYRRGSGRNPGWYGGGWGWGGGRGYYGGRGHRRGHGGGGRHGGGGHGGRR